MNDIRSCWECRYEADISNAQIAYTIVDIVRNLNCTVLPYMESL